MSFCVECSNNPHIEDEECTFTEYFDTPEQASDFIERHNRFKAIWLSEKGSWINERGKKIDGDWIYYWWSEAVSKDAAYGPPEGRGRGYPASKMTYIVDYVPSYQQG